MTLLGFALLFFVLWLVNSKLNSTIGSENGRFAHVDYRINTLRDRVEGMALPEPQEPQEPAAPKVPESSGPAQTDAGDIQPFNS